jgi:hypothetical protein
VNGTRAVPPAVRIVSGYAPGAAPAGMVDVDKDVRARAIRDDATAREFGAFEASAAEMAAVHQQAHGVDGMITPPVGRLDLVDRRRLRLQH